MTIHREANREIGGVAWRWHKPKGAAFFALRFIAPGIIKFNLIKYSRAEKLRKPHPIKILKPEAVLM